MQQNHPSRTHPFIQALRQPDYVLIAALQGLLFVSIVIVFWLAAAPVKADEHLKSCIGENLMARLSPDALNTARAEAANIPNGQGLLWKIEKQDVASSYLYGTMHVTDPRIANISKPLAEKIDQADIVVIETLDILDPVKAQGTILMNPELTMFTDGSDVTTNMSEDDRVFFEAEMARRGISLSMVSRMKPWMLFGMVGVSDCEVSRKMDGQKVLDVAIIERAQKGGKDTAGLETMLEQITVMASLPIEFQTKGLIESLRVGDLMDDVMETMTQLYLAQDIALFKPVMSAVAKQLSHEHIEDPDFGTFDERVIRDRNVTMVDRSQAILEKGNAFIAVGALHLPGEDGVIELLRKKGYVLTRVNQ